MLCLRTYLTELTAVSGGDPWYPAEDALAHKVSAWVIDNRDRIEVRAAVPAVPPIAHVVVGRARIRFSTARDSDNTRQVRRHGVIALRT